MSHLDDIRKEALPKSGSVAIVKDGNPAQTQGGRHPSEAGVGCGGK